MPSPDSAKQKSSIALYYPNAIGQASPGGSTAYGILVGGRDDGKGSVPVMAMSFLLKRGVRILSQTGYVNEKYGDFTLSLVCDLAGVDATLDDLVIELRKFKLVTSAESVSLKNQMFDGLLFPLVLMDSNRVVAVNSTLMFDLQEKLKTPAEKAALVDAGKQYGRDAVNRIKQKFDTGTASKSPERHSSAGTKVIQENVNRYMKASGWGKFSWEDGDNLERVFIQDPPTPVSKEAGGAGNLFLQGLVTGVAEALQGKRLSVVEDHYDVPRRLLTIGLTEQNLAMQMEAQTRKESLTAEEHATALEEVQRLISTVEQLDSVGKPPEKEEKIENVITIPVVAEGGNKFHFTLKRADPSKPAITQVDEYIGKPKIIAVPTENVKPPVELEIPKEKATESELPVEKPVEIIETKVVSEPPVKEEKIEESKAVPQVKPLVYTSRLSARSHFALKDEPAEVKEDMRPKKEEISNAQIVVNEETESPKPTQVISSSVRVTRNPKKSLLEAEEEVNYEDFAPRAFEEPEDSWV